MSNDTLRAEHDQVLVSLSTRVSTLHFAHAAVSLFVAIILFATAGKLWWDFWISYPEVTVACAAAGTLVLLYAAVRLTLGLLASGREKLQLTRLLHLRRDLQLDAPLSFQ